MTPRISKTIVPAVQAYRDLFDVKCGWALGFDLLSVGGSNSVLYTGRGSFRPKGAAMWGDVPFLRTSANRVKEALALAPNCNPISPRRTPLPLPVLSTFPRAERRASGVARHMACREGKKIGEAAQMLTTAA